MVHRLHDGRMASNFDKLLWPWLVNTVVMAGLGVHCTARSIEANLWGPLCFGNDCPSVSVTFGALGRRATYCFSSRQPGTNCDEVTVTPLDIAEIWVQNVNTHRSTKDNHLNIALL